MEQPAEISGARVLEKAFDLLYSFESHRPEQSLFDISRKLKFPPSTARRILKVLMARRLMQQDAATKLYRLGPGILYLASVARDGLDIRKIALSIMERLRDTTGENVGLHELRDGKRVCIEKVESQQVLRDTILVGSQFPAHLGATGKVLLAHLPADELKRYFESAVPLQAATPKTTTDPQTAASLSGSRSGFASCGGVSDGWPVRHQRADFDCEGKSPLPSRSR
jgi:DNA-binding IclR family transcriptional regulator